MDACSYVCRSMPFQIKARRIHLLRDIDSPRFDDYIMLNVTSLLGEEYLSKLCYDYYFIISQIERGPIQRKVILCPDIPWSSELTASS